MKLRLQYSLRAALLLFFIIAVAISLWLSYQQFNEIRRLRQENTQLRNDAGEIAIDESQKNKLYAVGMQMLEPGTWKWRLHVPDDRSLYLHAVSGQIPRSGSAVGQKIELPLESGNVIVTLGIRRDHNGNLEWILNANSNSDHTPMTPAAASLIDNYDCAYTYIGANSGMGSPQTVVSSGEKLEILRCRMYSSKSMPMLPTPLLESADGIMLWIDGSSN